MSEMRVTPQDLKGEIEDFPIEVVQKMCERQVEQGCPFNPSVFAQDPLADFDCGGFHWLDTDERYSFWCQVIHNREFDTFFEKYPKTTPSETESQAQSENVNYVVRTPDPVVNEVIKDLDSRSIDVGYPKYGVGLDRPDLGLRGSINHAYEESLDKSNYLKLVLTKLDSISQEEVVYLQGITDGTENEKLKSILSKVLELLK